MYFKKMFLGCNKTDIQVIARAGCAGRTKIDCVLLKTFRIIIYVIIYNNLYDETQSCAGFLFLLNFHSTFSECGKKPVAFDSFEFLKVDLKLNSHTLYKQEG